MPAVACFQVELIDDGCSDSVAGEVGFSEGFEDGQRLLAADENGGGVGLHVGGSARGCNRIREAAVGGGDGSD